MRRAEVGWTTTFHDLRHGMVSWSHDAGASPAVVQRDAGHASVTTTQGYMLIVSKVVGIGRLAAMQVMYDRVQAASQPEAAVPASAPVATLKQLSTSVLQSHRCPADSAAARAGPAERAALSPRSNVVRWARQPQPACSRWHR